MPNKDKLTLSIRVHDPSEKKDLKKSTSWMVADIDRADLDLADADFFTKNVLPAIAAVLNPMRRPKNESPNPAN